MTQHFNPSTHTQPICNPLMLGELLESFPNQSPIKNMVALRWSQRQNCHLCINKIWPHNDTNAMVNTNSKYSEKGATTKSSRTTRINHRDNIIWVASYCIVVEGLNSKTV